MNIKSKKIEEKEKKKKVLKGIVVSNKMMKTAVVKITRLVKHKLYKKRVKVSSKIFIHDQNNTCVIGDQVLITMCRPISKNKAFTLVNILNKD
jgi:small subunit ribosomal protein S17